MSNLTLTLNPSKATPKTVMFSEPIDENDFLGVAKLGNVYIPKATLAGMGWTPPAAGEDITTAGAVKVTIAV
jgi:hypothetical protein